MEKQTAIDKLNSIKEASLRMGGAEKIEQQHQRGRLTARERIDRLLDPGTFDETAMLMQNPIPDSEGRTTHISKVRGFGKVYTPNCVFHWLRLPMEMQSKYRLQGIQRVWLRPFIPPINS